MKIRKQTMIEKTLITAIKRKIPVVLLSVLILMVALILPHCSKKKSDASNDKETVTEVTKSLIPEIDKIRMDPEDPASVHIIRALPFLKDRRMRGVKFDYVWFVNDEEIIQHNERVLNSDYFKKGDQVYCNIVASRGKYQSKPMDSPKVKIRNSRPRIHSSRVEPFSIPSSFHYSINATDPDDDPLSYKLLEPQGLGIDVNPDTGELTWDIVEIPNKRQTSDDTDSITTISPIVVIHFEVRDSDNAIATAAITLNLRRGKEETY
jgi:hypothetical protein